MPEPLLFLPADRTAAEGRRAREREEAIGHIERSRRRLMWQCVGLTFCGIPFYAWSWHLVDPREAALYAAVGFVLSYAIPFFRWLAWLVATSEEFD